MARHTCNCCRTPQNGDQFAWRPNLLRGLSQPSARSRMCVTCEEDLERQEFHKKQNAETLALYKVEKG